MKHFPFLVFTLLSFQVASAQKIKIKLYNNTGFDLDSVMIADKFVGNIEKGEVAMVLYNKQLIMQGDVPFRRPIAIIKNKKAAKVMLGCSTKSKKINSGYLELDINFSEANEGFRLYWQRHLDTLHQK
jgi:hypothetical protein